MSRTRNAVALFAVLLIAFPAVAQSAQGDRGAAVVASAAGLSAGTLAGVWENKSRFVEFADGKGMRIVLKPYYGFVYEDTGWIPASVSGLSGGGSPSGSTGGVSRISVRYSGERSDAEVPAALLGDGLWFRFFSRIDTATATIAADALSSRDGATADSPAASGAAVGAPAVSASAAASGASAADEDAQTAELARRLAGFWRAAGVTDAMRLYRSEAAPDFYTYYFSGTRYWRIRYWATDARKRDILARFPGPDGVDVPVPKFIEISGTLYTCVTGTGTLVRNYETGSWTLANGKMAFKPDSVVYPGTAAEYRNPAKVTLSADGAVLAFGEPWLAKTAIGDLDADITAHNGLRRPPREPLLEFMDLDFRWEDIARIRNHGMDPAE